MQANISFLLDGSINAKPLIFIQDYNYIVHFCLKIMLINRHSFLLKLFQMLRFHRIIKKGR